MSVVMPLKKAFVEAAINARLKAILVDMPKHKALVGIPGGVKNDKAQDVGSDTSASYKKAKRNIKKLGLDYDNLESKVYFALLRRAQQPEMDVATYAAKTHFGSYSENIPARPWLTTTFKGETLKKIRDRAALFLKQCAKENRDAKGFLEKIGLFAAGEVKRNIKNGNWIENSPTTIAIKGSDKPLKDTSTMTRAVTAWVKKK